MISATISKPFNLPFLVVSFRALKNVKLFLISLWSQNVDDQRPENAELQKSDKSFTKKKYFRRHARLNLNRSGHSINAKFQTLNSSSPIKSI